MEEGLPDGSPDPGGGGRPLDVISGWLRRLNRWTHWIAGATVVGLMFLTVIDVVGRRFFNRPFQGTVELTQIAMVIIIYLGFAYAEHNNDHIAVDIVYSRLRRGIQLALSVITSVFAIVLVGLLAYRLYAYSGVLRGGGYTTPTRGIPLSPFALVAVGGAVLFALALVDSAVASLRRPRDQGR
jgi:TRAP-type C4-dicarboxylate transport system permease small subunit